ncbi:hypothetical protein [Histidinibacterium aquaticum]|uniref:Uncharacterized protein n=1 Tax=Histidinibacterium aquaticum TaxID=2613962 RepID=A0A5J5GNZ3_9RHOB|nr:hypothetical protein [Histidinibacterium aquaticum]KAA9009765.1 hypothetical protein F3S47_00400 [Histidinibacterium aquaticum]
MSLKPLCAAALALLPLAAVAQDSGASPVTKDRSLRAAPGTPITVITDLPDVIYEGRLVEPGTQAASASSASMLAPRISPIPPQRPRRLAAVGEGQRRAGAPLPEQPRPELQAMTQGEQQAGRTTCTSYERVIQIVDLIERGETQDALRAAVPCLEQLGASRDVIAMASLAGGLDDLLGEETISAAPIRSFAETGTLTLDHNEQTVTLQQSYETPVVIAFVATERGGQPVNVRVTEASGNDLTLRLQEPNYLDGTHADERVNYLVVEAGTWILPDGTFIEAGVLDSNLLSPQGFKTVQFDAAFDGTPVILSQVQTSNGPDFVTTRQRDADATGFELTMQEEEALNDGGHTAERLGWVAIEAGSGRSGNISWLSGRGSGVTHSGGSVGLGARVDGGVNVIAALSSFAGGNTAWARGRGSTDTAFEIFVEEDESQDDETEHASETVDFFVFDGAGTLGAYDYDDFRE